MSETPTTTEEVTTKNTLKEGEYVAAIGRRKTATAQVRLYNAKKTDFTINDKKASEFFGTDELIKIINDPFTKSKIKDKFKVTVVVKGGGPNAQAEAIRHGITRALTKLDAELRPALKKLGFLKRDPRSKERKKPGLKKARKAEQWSKR